MTNWIPHPTILSGETIELRPLEAENVDELIQVASEKRIWEHYASDFSDNDLYSSVLDKAFTARDAGREYPFVIFHKAENRIIGSTRFLDIQAAHKKLEIGWTWIHPDHWGTHINNECKQLLLTFCFEELNCVRVHLKTDELNIRSRKAIEKIGGQYEGIIRNDMIRDDGTFRSSASFSILDSEWNDLKSTIFA